MSTSSRYRKGVNSPADIWIRNNFTKISINSSLSFWLNPFGDKPSGYYDFIGILLHELGHVLNLNHDVQYADSLKSLMYCGDNTSLSTAANRLNLTQWADAAKEGVQYVIDKSKIQPLNDYSYIKPLFSGNIPTLSSAPVINPSNDTTLCAELVSSYSLSSNIASNNRWNTGQTTQTINITPPLFDTGVIADTSQYTVKLWNENCTVVSYPSLPVSVIWNKYCIRPPGDDKFTDDEISTRSQGG
jgi:hypothetical protein